MLDDRDWKTLQDVERELRVEDPQFHRSFHARAQWLDRDGLRVEFSKVAMIAAIVLGVLLLLLGSWAGAFAVATLAGGMWLSRRARG